MKVVVKNLGSDEFILDVGADMEVDELKNLIHERTGVLPSSQKLLLTEMQLESGKCLSAYGIEEDASITLVTLDVQPGRYRADITIEFTDSHREFPCDGGLFAETSFILDISEDLIAKLEVQMAVEFRDEYTPRYYPILGLPLTDDKKYLFSLSGKVQDAQLLIETPMPEGLSITSRSCTPDSVNITSTVADLSITPRNRGHFRGKLRQNCDIQLKLVPRGKDSRYFNSIEMEFEDPYLENTK